MNSGWRIGSIAGIPVVIAPSMFLFVGLVTYISYDLLLQNNVASRVALLVGFGAAIGLFASILLHEIGHSLVARSQGIAVNSITLFIFGGVASIEQESKTPIQAMQVAIAGPAVSFLLFLLLLGINVSLPLSNALRIAVDALMGWNLLLALFNLIPGLPLDGGHVLRAAIWKITGSKLKGTRWAARAGLFLGWTAVILAGLLYITYGFQAIGALWIAFISWSVIIRNANSYLRITNLQEALISIKTADAMTREFRVVDANLSLEKFTTDYLLREEGLPPAFYVTSDGRYRGMVEPEELQAVERSLWQIQKLGEFVHPLTAIPSLTEASAIITAIGKLEAEQLKRVTVLSPAGAVAGVLDRGDIVRALANKLGVPIGENFIRQIKETGAYPPGLPLGAIAQSLEG